MKIQIAVNPTCGDSVSFGAYTFYFVDKNHVFNVGYHLRHREHELLIQNTYYDTASLLFRELVKCGLDVTIGDGMYDASVQYFPYWLWDKKEPRHCKIIDCTGYYPKSHFTAVDNSIIQ